MLRATSVIRKPAVRADKIADTVVLDHEGRQRRRAMLRTVGGLDVLLDLDKAGVLGEGDGLKLEDGRLIAVSAAEQELLEVRAENPLRLMRLAWHIGNRHTPAEITADALYIEHDHVLAEMIRGQGCSIAKVMRPFKPERGAYDHAGHDHAGHDHAEHAHGHDHHGHDHAAHQHAAHQHAAHEHAAHEHEAHEHAAHQHAAHEHEAHEHAAHAHGPDCGCGHDHHHHEHSHDVLDVATPRGAGSHDHAHAHGHDHDHDHHRAAHGDDHAHHHDHAHGHAARARHDH
ncbi:MAG: urease accessory protein UreE [Bosea sp.]|nr:urease accessory protein UreE [Bosea sp. (in: a-proteobacteria)]